MKDDWPYKCNAIAALTWVVISNVKVSISPKLGKVHIKKKRFDTHWSNFRQGVSINKFPPLLQILNKRRNPLVLFNFTLDCRAPFPNLDSAARHISVCKRLVSQVHCILYFFWFCLFVCLCLQYVESVFVWIKRKNENSKVLTLPPRKCQGVNIFHAMTHIWAKLKFFFFKFDLGMLFWRFPDKIVALTKTKKNWDFFQKKKKILCFLFENFANQEIPLLSSRATNPNSEHFMCIFNRWALIK